MDKWISGTVSARLGDLHYEVVYQGKHLKRHVDQMRRFEDGSLLAHTPSNEALLTTIPGVVRRAFSYGDTVTSQQAPINSESGASAERTPAAADEQFSTPNASPVGEREVSSPVLRRTTRLRRAPLRYSP